MFKRLLFAAIFTVLSSVAWAANPTCPTRPLGDYTNACASTNYIGQMRSGNTNTIGTVSGTLTPGHCLKVDANNNIIDSGGSCATESPSLFGSGSNQQTTATTVASNASVTLAAAKDFAQGQGVSCENCGTLQSFNPPTGLTVSATGNALQGPTGSTSYAYKAACVDAGGGVGAATSATTIANGYATLGTVTVTSTEIAYNYVTWTKGSGCAGTAIWRSTGGGAYVLLGVFDGGGQGSILWDTGLPTVSIPWLPATPPASALADRLVTTISSISGTAAVLAVAPSQSGSGLLFRHDDTAAINSALLTITAANLPSGTYNIENITLPTNLASLTGQGLSATQIVSWSASGTGVQGTSMPSGFFMSGININALTYGANESGFGLFSTSNPIIVNSSFSGGLFAAYFSGVSSGHFTNNIIPTWYQQAFSDTSGVSNEINDNNIGAGSNIGQAIAITVYNSTGGDFVKGNIINGGTSFGISLNTVNNGSVIGNTIFGTLRESLIQGPGGNTNFWSGNYTYSSVSIDYCMSMTNNSVSSVTITSNTVSGNEFNNCGTAGIQLGEFWAGSRGTGVSIHDNNISNNTVRFPVRTQGAGIPAIILNGAFSTNNFVEGNTFEDTSTYENYDIAEVNISGWGVPTYTHIGTNFGTHGSGVACSPFSAGTACVSGTGSGPETWP